MLKNAFTSNEKKSNATYFMEPKVFIKTFIIDSINIKTFIINKRKLIFKVIFFSQFFHFALSVKEKEFFLHKYRFSQIELLLKKIKF
jgi:hypothetical protein